MAKSNVENTKRVIDPVSTDGESAWEKSLRPKTLDDFPGQTKVKEKLRIFIRAAVERGEALDHVLFCGPPGLGKTTLAYILANQMGVEIRCTSGPALDRKGDLAAVLTSLKPNSILFIDEIHRLNKAVEEYLYSAMDDFTLDIITGEGLGARAMKFKLPPFTLAGATTRAGLLGDPFRSRFGIVERLAFYDRADLALIVTRTARLLGIEIEDQGAHEIARRSRGTPRIVNRLVRRIRDYAQVKGDGSITRAIAEFALNELEVDQLGLDDMDRKILRLICEKFDGGPVGVETLSAALSEEPDTLEEVYEPYLLQEGLLQKTPRGRVATRLAFEHLGIRHIGKAAQQALLEV